MGSRLVEAEILDQLPEGHPDAEQNRKDLRKLNGIMGNHRWLRRVLAEHLRPGDHVLELGAGDGVFASHQVAGLLDARGDDFHYTGLDRCSRPAGLPEPFGWEHCDALEYSGWQRHSIVIVNFLLHQFTDAELNRLGGALRPHARVLIANETVRGLWPSILARAAFALGLNHVSRHDAVVSVRAGFRGRELATLLGMEGSGWSTRTNSTFLGAFRMEAQKSEAHP